MAWIKLYCKAVATLPEIARNPKIRTDADPVVSILVSKGRRDENSSASSYQFSLQEVGAKAMMRTWFGCARS